MHSAKKQQAFLAPQFRKFFQKQNPLPHRITHRSRGAVVHDRFAATVEPKRFPGAQALFLAGKQHRRRIAQHAIIRPRPVEPFLEMLQRIRPLKPRIEHPVRVNAIRGVRAAQCPPHPEGVVLPKPIHHDEIVVIPMLAQPGYETTRVTILAPRRPKSVTRQRTRLHPWIGGMIERDNFHRVPRPDIDRRKLQHAFNRAAAGRIQRADRMQNAQGFIHGSKSERHLRGAISDSRPRSIRALSGR